ncbi:AbrB family transcriptional regulator [Bartonella tamiae]|uniref:Membrane protein AbrB duplication n=1 Tax=Bartonella tamiae Th239 TaxID=1094558 RepID=J1JWJ4_9HYPH|nr:AbrB family transcriptional regulator [Bartonella tamiae]EJF88935.1 membrane protein AbrB duplication [Bartonella tamiae Th239]EJF94815.1 membrane protein AbrB duplication [Bartonella tamiae Th307]
MTKRFFFIPNMEHSPRLLCWIILFILTAIFITGLELLEIPAALLLGPMIAAILIGISNSTVKISSPLFNMAQGVVGCMIAQVITLDILNEAIADWPLFIGGVFSVIIIANIIGYFLAKKQILPGTTAIWGAAPGGASAMVLMAQSYGADERLVAVMQYLRVVIVAALASLLARFLSTGTVVHETINWFPSIDYKSLAITFLIAFGGSLGARALKIPAGGMLVPFVLAAILHNLGWIVLVLPPWLLAISYMMIGWTVGLRFTRAILLHALKALPILFGTTFLLIGACSILAFFMSYVAGVDLLTAYLATSPGGADSVSIIAASSPVNVPFVMAFQTTRFIIVTITGPIISKLISKRLNLFHH